MAMELLQFLICFVVIGVLYFIIGFIFAGCAVRSQQKAMKTDSALKEIPYEEFCMLRDIWLMFVLMMIFCPIMAALRRKFAGPIEKFTAWKKRMGENIRRPWIWTRDFCQKPWGRQVSEWFNATMQWGFRGFRSDHSPK